MQILSKTMMLFALLTLSLGSCGDDSDSGSDNDAGTDAGSDTDSDNRSDALVCGSAECGTVVDNIGIPRTCADTCMDNEICQDTTCVCQDLRDDATVCGEAECGTIMDNCLAERNCIDTCTGYDVCRGTTCVCQDLRNDATVCSDAEAECGTAVDNCFSERSCNTCVGSYVCQDTTCVCQDLRDDAMVCSVAGAACGTVADNCSTDRICSDTCTGNDVCQGTTCVCQDLRDDATICGDAACGTVADNCLVDRICIDTCTGYDVCQGTTCVCQDLRNDATVCSDAEAECGTAVDNCEVERTCSPCTNPDICNEGIGQCYTPVSWVPIAGGTYDMGVDHTVTLPSFDMLKAEVTAAQYAACVTDEACEITATDTYCNWNEEGYKDHPINCVSWQQSVDYCIWMGGRLPSESEWEYAARSQGEDTTYPWGDVAASCDYAVMNTDGASAGCGTDRTWEACSKPDGNTAQGLCDMAGNVSEWIQDQYQPDYAIIPTDGSAYESSGTDRVFRGGSLSSFPSVFLETRNRSYDDPSLQLTNRGFRCARNAL